MTNAQLPTPKKIASEWVFASWELISEHYSPVQFAIGSALRVDDDDR